MGIFANAAAGVSAMNKIPPSPVKVYDLTRAKGTDEEMRDILRAKFAKLEEGEGYFSFAAIAHFCGQPWKRGDGRIYAHLVETLIGKGKSCLLTDQHGRQTEEFHADHAVRLEAMGRTALPGLTPKVQPKAKKLGAEIL